MQEISRARGLVPLVGTLGGLSGAQRGSAGLSGAATQETFCRRSAQPGCQCLTPGHRDLPGPFARRERGPPPVPGTRVSAPPACPALGLAGPSRTASFLGAWDVLRIPSDSLGYLGPHAGWATGCRRPQCKPTLVICWHALPMTHGTSVLSPCPHSGVTLASSSGGCEDAMHE